MKRKIVSMLMGLLVLLVFLPNFTFAQDSADTENSEWVQLRKTDISPDLLKYLENGGYVKYQNPYIQPERISDFLKNVVYFGNVTDVTLSKITDNTNKFAKTKLGTFAMVLIAYNVAGEEFISFTKRLIALIVFLALYLIWWRKKMLPRSVIDTVDENGITHYKMQVPLLWVQALWLAAFLIVALIII